MADIARKIKRYPTDLTDEEWGRIEPLMPKPPKRGWKIRVDLREMLNAIRGYAIEGAEGPTVRKRTLAYCTQCRRVALAVLVPLEVAGAIKDRCVYCTQCYPPR